MQQYLAVMLSLVHDAGRIALRLMDNSRPELKADNSVITAADREVSALAHRRLKRLLATGEHALVDEEDPRKVEYLDEQFLERTPYIWSIDPVDGTRVYANHMPHYGVSIGLIRNRKPWLGAVYFPTLKELFYCDGDNAWRVTNAFSFGARRALIKPVDEVISDRSIFISSDEIGTEFFWKSNDCRLMILATAVSEFCWVAAGRACGSLSRTHLWDIAGSWPIAEKAGLKFRNARTGATLDRVEADLFHRTATPWKLKEYYILSSARNFPLLRKRILFPGEVAA
jgi:myo-inositol-1(or 4)-monophosphatase